VDVNKNRWLGWWYAAIGAGFFLLAVNRILTGYSDWTVPLRFVVAAGFLVLAWIQLRGSSA
jgi:hypothetical protein